MSIPPRIAKEKQKLDKEQLEGLFINQNPKNFRHF